MYLTFTCPGCEHRTVTGELSGDCQLTCEACGWTKPVSSDQIGTSGPRKCLRCGNSDLWRQKNFPQWAGLLCVAAGAISSSIAWAYHRPVLALGILMAFALADMLLYIIMPDVLVCYRCQTKHHQTDVSGHATFNHELAERYRQERIRERKVRPPTPASPLAHPERPSSDLK